MVLFVFAFRKQAAGTMRWPFSATYIPPNLMHQYEPLRLRMFLLS
jgi:hypothetical protein